MAKITITIEDVDNKQLHVSCHSDVSPDEENGEPTKAMLLSHMIQKLLLEDFVEATGGAVAHKGIGHHPQAGSRVGALRCVEEDTAYLYGYGVYEGDFPIGQDDAPQPKGGVADLLERNGQINPRIRLDNGQVVWGCECWWGEEKNIKAQIEGLKVVRVNISQDRASMAR